MHKVTDAKDADAAEQMSKYWHYQFATRECLTSATRCYDSRRYRCYNMWFPYKL